MFFTIIKENITAVNSIGIINHGKKTESKRCFVLIMQGVPQADQFAREVSPCNVSQNSPCGLCFNAAYDMNIPRNIDMVRMIIEILTFLFIYTHLTIF